VPGWNISETHGNGLGVY